MRDASSTPTEVASPQNGVLVLSGFGLRIAVERGHLIVSDGRGRERREGRFPRASRQLRRLVVIGHTGSVSFDALRWLRGVGCAFVQIDRDGEVVVAAGAAGLNDARLRRAQAMATTNGVGVAIARDLLGHKLTGQAAIVDRLGTPPAADVGAHVRWLLAALPGARTVDQLRSLEAEAAGRYWSAWAGVPVRWARRDAARVPEHWRTFGSRSSPLTSSPRLAVDPACALLNYVYSLVEAEARIALLAVGLDPGIGVLHADQRARDSLALDLMEAVRPGVNGWVLDTLAGRTFAKADFHETREGACRLMPPLPRQVAETAPRWAAAVAPVAEGFAGALMGGASTRPLPAPLTQANRSAGRGGGRRDARREQQRTPELPPACMGCGIVLDDAGRSYCDDCLPERRKELTASLSTAGPAAVAQRRGVGDDPSHGGAAARARGERNAAHVEANQHWAREHSSDAAADAQASDAEAFARDVLPGLQGVPLRVMAEAAGLSLYYCSLIRRGQRVPHPRHWAALAGLGGTRER